MLDLDDDALGLIRAARGGDDPSPEERARVLNAFRAERDELETSDAVPQAKTRHNSPITSLPRRPRRWTLTWSIAALVSLASAGAFADWHAVARQVRSLSEWPARVLGQGSPRGNEVPVPKRATTGRGSETGAWTESSIALNPQPEVPSVLVPAPLPIEAAPVEAAPIERATIPKAIPRLATAPLEAELTLIASARDALSNADYARSLEATREHARRFPRGALLEERHAIAALAQCRAGGDTAQARAFVQRWPDSLFTPRVKRDCAVSNLVPSESVPDTD